ncbi:glycoside hydrolase family 65 protein, partial [PVC group bacterium]|nr:glycoside hydrolase family 65 protein [PVC group bacterium]
MHIPSKSNPQWLIEEKDLSSDLEKEALNAVFSTGNGVFCCRGTTPFCSSGTSGTLIGGLYSDSPPTLTWIPTASHPGRDTENYPDDKKILENERIIAMPIAPNLWKTQIQHNVNQIQISKTHRTLDMKQGLLFSETRIESEKSTWVVKTCRFVSLQQRDIAAERTCIVSTNSEELTLTPILDNSVLNGENILLWENEHITVDTETGTTVWNGHTQKTDEHAYIVMRSTGNTTRSSGTDASSGIPFCSLLDRFVTVASTVSSTNPAQEANDACRLASESTFNTLLKEHTAKWQAVWKRADIAIDGPIDDQKAIRYALFQLISSLPGHSDYSIGAKFLSGEGYRGAVFWDTDIFILPYLARVLPEKARDHIAYRFRTLDKAMELSKQEGHKGARYPWEASPDGTDMTAPWLILQKTQIHVTADVAWGIIEYFKWTHDTEFMKSCGMPILRQCAVYWADIVSQGNGNLENACGPDENHPHSDNNAYTNFLVRYLLTAAADICENASSEEKTHWREMADRIPAPRTNNQCGMEQYKGFFKLPVTEINEKSFSFAKNQKITKTDILMLPFL